LTLELASRMGSNGSEITEALGGEFG